MATEQIGRDKSFVAGADLRTKHYFICKLHTTEGQVVLGAAGTDKLVGVLQNKPNASQEAVLAGCDGGGTSKVVASGVMAKGTLVTSDANGRAVAATEKDFVVGRLLDAATAVDEIVEMQLLGFLY